MVTVNVGKDEWYPVYTLDFEEVPDSLREYYATFEIDTEELAAIKRVYMEFHAMQAKLATLYHLHK